MPSTDRWTPATVTVTTESGEVALPLELDGAPDTFQREQVLASALEDAAALNPHIPHDTPVTVTLATKYGASSFARVLRTMPEHLAEFRLPWIHHRYLGEHPGARAEIAAKHSPPTIL